jgi:hypothetical protein
MIIITVKQGKCAPIACGDGEIQNLDLTSCVCEPLTHEGLLIDTSADPHPGFMFAFDLHNKFTLREWANADGNYEWSLPSTE